MANRIVGNVYIIDSGSIVLDDFKAKIQSIIFYSTNTTGELILVDNATLSTQTNELVRIRNNQSQPFSLPYYLGGVNFQRMKVQTLTAGTAFLYLS